jgi:SAM-dependent methyltransferase
VSIHQRVRGKLVRSFVGGPKVGTRNLENRNAWLEKTLAAIPAGQRILDAGAGELQYRRFCEHLDYVSQDSAEYDASSNVGLQGEGWDTSKIDIVSDIISIPVESKSFDAIMCIEVFEHVPRPVDAVKEFSRILKPGGTLVITTPVSSLTHQAPYYFYNGYSRFFYEKILDEFDLDVIEISFNGNFFEMLGQELRRNDEMAARYAESAGPSSREERLAVKVLLKRLEALTKADTGSSEVTSHGIHVVAKRR